MTHRPMYCSDLDEEDQHVPGAGISFHLFHFVLFYLTFTLSIAIQVALEPILVQYAVDIFFCGHMHMYGFSFSSSPSFVCLFILLIIGRYERVNPVINGTVIQTAANGVYPI